MWDFLKPTKTKLVTAIVLWLSYWMIGRINSLVTLPLIKLLSPSFISRETEKFQSQFTGLAGMIREDILGQQHLVFKIQAVHIAVAVVIGYLVACLIVNFLKKDKPL